MGLLRITSPLAGLIALLIIFEGILGLAPDIFTSIVRFFQTPPMVYLAAALRVVFGIVLVRAASGSRVPAFLRIFGSIILIGGALTPFVGIRFAQEILDWWAAHGAALVRVFAGVCLALGVFTGYAITPKGQNT